MNDADYEVKYYRNTKIGGMVSYSLEVGLSDDDKLVIDDPSFGRLRHKLDEILPAALYTRMVAAVERH